MIDLPGRREPRFPASLEFAARGRIGAAIERFLSEFRDRSFVLGFASGARGGDILFHEECRTRQINTIVVLPFEPDQFVGTSVEGVSEGDWPRRFWDLWNVTPVDHRRVLGLTQEDDPYATCNLALLEMAQRHGDVHLIALWDGKGGDGRGGTADLVSRLRTEERFDIFAPNELRS
jgi:hypothetical protein